MRMRKRMRAKKSAASKKATRSAAMKALAEIPRGTRVALVVGICVVGTAMLMASREPSRAPAEVAATRAAVDKALDASATPPPVLKDPLQDRESFPPEAPVTLTGCLEQANESFRLKNATGENAPKTRSWKSGFLKKSAAPIEVVDARQRLRLVGHVGEQVSVTGVLMNREIQARSLQRVATSCS